jgi:hypothetical protein
MKLEYNAIHRTNRLLGQNKHQSQGCRIRILGHIIYWPFFFLPLLVTYSYYEPALAVCTFRHPTYIPLSCIRRHNVIVRPCQWMLFPYILLLDSSSNCWSSLASCEMACGSVTLFFCAREMPTWRGQLTSLRGVFTPSDNRGSRSTHMHILSVPAHALTCVVRTLAVPLIEDIHSGISSSWLQTRGLTKSSLCTTNIVHNMVLEQLLGASRDTPPP